ncbi:SDR family NAD(P)-dependent oxidoreductase, partial [Candidatus Bathyarchaeota archaeon]|nr:SDR family NAD(P)-dependent oxidoreductase [Candidatus Bathyarchaeota archaeon]
MTEYEVETGQASKRHAALVTGSTSGIGFAIALELAKNGFNIAINGTREEDKVKPILSEIKCAGAEVFYVRADVSSSEDRRRIVEELRNRFGRIDVLVNNAGIAPKERRDLLEISEENFDRVIEVNLKGPFFLTQLISKWMIELKQKLAQY